MSCQKSLKFIMLNNEKNISVGKLTDVEDKQLSDINYRVYTQKYTL